MLDLQRISKIKYSTISALGSVLVLISATFPFINNIVAVFAPGEATSANKQYIIPAALLYLL